jgi:peptidoglycan/xylan/chitin deacetylase (PgdA/CDA1 family)
LSKENIALLNSMQISENIYKNKIDLFLKKLLKSGINANIINESEIKNLKKSEILIVLDDFKLSNETVKEIKKFLKKGGNLIFNYHFGYYGDERVLLKSKRITDITNLNYIGEFSAKNIFFIPKILSPLNLKKLLDKRKYLTLYGDVLPLFKSQNTPDYIMSNWAISSTQNYENRMLNINEAGIAWHGFYKKGKWFYFSFPSYVFLDMDNKTFKGLFESIINYSLNDISVKAYPFVDSKNAVFISEDTEYKYENMINFANLAKEKNIPATLFCVARLALQYKDITKKAADLSNIEIASHSYTHTKIQGAPKKKVIKEIKSSKEVLEQITGKKIYGFRPPREEIDKTMENVLREAGYKYVMEKTKPYLLPKEEHKGLITIPRHGTDDYIYLINLDWDKKQILQKIIQETEMLTSINALYTLSVHTHLLSYKSNLEVLSKYFDYLTDHNIKPLNGMEIAKRAIWNKNITITSQALNKQTFIYIHNKNNNIIKNFTLRIYWPNSTNITITPEISSVKIKIVEENSKRKYTDVKIETLKPRSTISLILEANE